MHTEFDFKAEVPEVKCVVEGMIPAGLITFIIGRPGFGKSFFTEQLAISVVTGTDFMGHTSTKGNVLLIDQDSGPDTIQIRLRKFLNYYNGTANPCKLYAELQKDYTIADDSLVNVINSYKDVSLVIIDSLNKICNGLNPNDTKSMGNLRKLRSNCLRPNLAIVVVHHIGKTCTMVPEAMMTCPDPSVLFMGNTSIPAEVDSYFVITTPDAGKSKFNNLWIRPVVKRYTFTQENFIAKFEQSDETYHISFDKLYGEIDNLPSIEQDIVTLFKESPRVRTVKEIYSDMGDMYGQNAIRESLRNLEAKGVLLCHRKTDTGQLFRYEMTKSGVN